MLVLDTNVISALMKPDENRPVVIWFDGVREQSLWTTAVSVMEIRYGLRRMHDGRRRYRMEQAFDTMLETNIREILEFDIQAAENTARFLATAHSEGRNLKIPDCQIAGIVAVRDATLVTRNIRDFQSLGLRLVNPWD